MKRVLRGKITSDKMDKTVVVLVERTKKHPIYRKNYTVSTKFKAHDENNEYHTGDMVAIVESSPKAKTKKWTVSHKLSAKELEE